MSAGVALSADGVWTPLMTPTSISTELTNVPVACRSGVKVARLYGLSAITLSDGMVLKVMVL